MIISEFRSTQVKYKSGSLPNEIIAKRSREHGTFLNIHCCKTSKKLGGPFGEFICETSLTMPKKTERGDPLVSPGIACYAEKKEKLFWFSSLGQKFQFGAIKFRRTLRFVDSWIEKSHYNSRVSLYEAPTKNCKKKTVRIVPFKNKNT